ncbi:MAG: toxin-activating lysine-acyltransferase [Rhodospirillales bacterium]|nr:toxin-activating lysine-acyltransferase [Rhodospirillales bacterium]
MAAKKGDEGMAGTRQLRTSRKQPAAKQPVGRNASAKAGVKRQDAPKGKIPTAAAQPKKVTSPVRSAPAVVSAEKKLDKSNAKRMPHLSSAKTAEGRIDANITTENGNGVVSDIPSPAEILGHVGWLMMRSSAHRHVFVSDFEWLVVPPITLKQFRIYMKEQTPFAFATWARLTEEAEARLTAGHRRLAPADWNGGDRLWLVDLIAPFGGMEGILRDLSEKVFPGVAFKALVPGEGGKGLRVMTVGDVSSAQQSRGTAPKPPAAKAPAPRRPTDVVRPTGAARFKGNGKGLGGLS